jgi:hypothetical protein
MVYGIQIVLNIHPDWVVLQMDVENAFNTISKKVIFEKLCVVGGQLFQLFLFVQSFYAQWVPLFFNHHSHMGDLLVIHYLEGTCQGVLFVGPFLCWPIFMHCNILWGFSLLYIYFLFR